MEGIFHFDSDSSNEKLELYDKDYKAIIFSDCHACLWRHGIN